MRPALLHKMANPHKQTHEVHITKPSSQFSFLGPEEDAPLQGLFPPAPAPPNKVIYSLSSGAGLAPIRSRSRSRSRSRPISHGTSPSSRSSFMSPPPKSSSFFSDDGAQSAHSVIELPPINLFDYLKTLLSQLAASISAMKIAYAHQQAALNPYNMQEVAGCGRRESVGRSNVTATDKAMVKELERLSQLHLQLSVLPHMKLQGQCTCASEGEGEEEVKSKEMLKRYEGIITRFHDEMRRKDAVTAALKETLAKSMLQGEKLERRVKALEFQLMRADVIDPSLA